MPPRFYPQAHNLQDAAAHKDGNGNFVTGGQKVLDLNLLEPSYQKMVQAGLTIKTSFDLKPGKLHGPPSGTRLRELPDGRAQRHRRHSRLNYESIRFQRMAAAHSTRSLTKGNGRKKYFFFLPFIPCNTASLTSLEVFRCTSRYC
jgi:hypothetical protein